MSKVLIVYYTAGATTVKVVNEQIAPEGLV